MEASQGPFWLGFDSTSSSCHSTSHSFSSVTIIFGQGSAAKANVIKTLLWVVTAPLLLHRLHGGVSTPPPPAKQSRAQSVCQVLFPGDLTETVCIWTRMMFPSAPAPQPLSETQEASIEDTVLVTTPGN